MSMTHPAMTNNATHAKNAALQNMTDTWRVASSNDNSLESDSRREIQFKIFEGVPIVVELEG